MLDIGGRTAAVLELFHKQGLDAIGIAATPGSVLLEKARRAFWQEKGEADRPPPAPLGRHDARSATGRDDYDPERDGERKGGSAASGGRGAGGRGEAGGVAARLGAKGESRDPPARRWADRCSALAGPRQRQ